MSNVPSWYELLLLALASYRLWRLIGLDTITQPLRLKLTGLPDTWKHGDDPPEGYREWLAVWMQCPWCSGAWITVTVWAAWLVFPHAAIVAAVPFAISALVGIAAHFTTD